VNWGLVVISQENKTLLGHLTSPPHVRSLRANREGGLFGQFLFVGFDSLRAPFCAKIRAWRNNTEWITRHDVQIPARSLSPFRDPPKTTDPQKSSNVHSWNRLKKLWPKIGIVESRLYVQVGTQKFGRRTESDVQVKIVFRITPCNVFWMRQYQLNVETPFN